MLTVRVTTSVLEGIGVTLSLFRLWFRWKIRRLWWEDVWSGIACLCAIVQLTSEWTYLKGDWQASLVGFWMYALGFTCIVWAVRMSILFSVARIVHSTKRMRWTVIVLATFFTSVFVAYETWKIWWFALDSSWTKQTDFYTRPARWLPHSMYVYELCTDCVSDALLISLPVRLLWKMNLPANQRRMIIVIFSSSIIVTMASIFRAVCQIMRMSSLIGVASDVEIAFSVIVCNLLVVVTLVYRYFRRLSGSNGTESDSDDDDFTTPISGRTATPALTTVDVDAHWSDNTSSSQECTS
ncbi:hypothetical protein JVU11DRAFT_9799 [Chiua virens]|nr:hypothetical protein JVU11DRAFT_9799 [Chiua virens]